MRKRSSRRARCCRSSALRAPFRPGEARSCPPALFRGHSRFYLAQSFHSSRRESLAVPELLPGLAQLLQQALHQRAGRLRARRPRLAARRRLRRLLPLGQAAPQLPDGRLLGSQLQLEVLQLLSGLVVQGAERVVPRHFILQAPVFPVQLLQRLLHLFEAGHQGVRTATLAYRAHGRGR